MPNDNDKWLTFKNYGKQLKLGFAVYADFECILSKVNACDPNPEKSSTTPIEKNILCSYSYKVACTNPTYSKPAVVYRGDDAVLHFLKSLQKEEHEIFKILKKVEPMKLKEQDELDFQNVTTCHICEKPLLAEKSETTVT